jgi:hypothetical protein
VNFDIGLLKSCFLTIRKLPQCLGNGISETLNLTFSSGLQFSSRFQHANLKQLSTALHAAVICPCVKYAYFVCKLRLHFPDSEHLRGFVSHEIFGNVFRHSEDFAQHPPTIHGFGFILLKIGVLQNTQKGVILYSLLAHRHYLSFGRHLG